MGIKRALLRNSISCGLLAMSAVIAMPAEAQTRTYQIRATSLSKALREYARASGEQIIFTEDLVRGKRSPALTGTFTEQEALDRLLQGSGLSADRTPTGAIMIVRTLGNGVQGPNAEQSPPSPGEASVGAVTESAEIVITAQKRSERLSDVPIPVSVVRTQALLDRNQLRLQDYYTQVPGLTYTPVANGNTSLTIRGITSGGLTNPTVGITIDDIPFGAASVLVGGLLVPDLDPGELSQIEVLRGPQGTLYGASSLGGLLKFETLDPSTDRLSGRLQAGVNSIHDAHDLGYNVRGSVNLPISDKVALRVGAFDRKDPGYIDDVLTGREDVNDVGVQGGHASLLMRPADDWSVKIGALIQHAKIDGAPSVDVPTVGYPQTNGLEGLEQTRIANSGWEKDTAQSYNLTIKGKVGRADLTSLTGYSIYNEHNSLDYTYLVGPIMQRLYGVGGSNFLNHYLTKKFSQEVRLNIPIGEKIEWLVGGFYTTERSLLTQDITAADKQSGAIVGTWSSARGTFHYREYAALTDVTFHLTDRIKLQIGGRESHITVPYDPFVETGPRFGGTVTAPATVIVPANKSSANAFTYLVTPSFKITPDLLLYARFASGYRPGAPNTGVGVVQGVVPASYAPDKTYDYEAGLKGDFFDRLLSLDLSIYHVDWKNIQLAFFSPQTGQSYTSNAGGAKSNGFELSAELKPQHDLRLRGWVSYNDAVITKPFPAGSTISAPVGSRLPTSPPWSGNISVDKDFTLPGRLKAFAGATMSYVGDRKGAFLAAGRTRADFPSYVQLNLDLGVRAGSWTATAYANNITDRRGILNGGAGDFPPFHYNYIQPRTIGINLAKAF